MNLLVWLCFRDFSTFLRFTVDNCLRFPYGPSTQRPAFFIGGFRCQLQDGTNHNSESVFFSDRFEIYSDVMFTIFTSLRQHLLSRWWQLKYFSCSSLFGGNDPIWRIIFFRWVGLKPPTSYPCSKRFLVFCWHFLASKIAVVSYQGSKPHWWMHL